MWDFLAVQRTGDSTAFFLCRCKQHHRVALLGFPQLFAVAGRATIPFFYQDLALGTIEHRFTSSLFLYHHSTRTGALAIFLSPLAENRLKLPPLQCGKGRWEQLLKVRHQRIRFLLWIILRQRYKIDMFRVEQFTNVLCRCCQRIVGR